MSHMSAHKASVTRRRNLAVERANRSYIPRDDYAAQASAQRAYRASFEHGSDQDPINRIALQCVLNGTLETHGIEHVREILERTVHTRSLVVKERTTDHVVKPQRANSAPNATACKVAASKEFAANAAHSLHESRRELIAMLATLPTLTGKRKAHMRAQIHNLRKSMRAEFGVNTDV